MWYIVKQEPKTKAELDIAIHNSIIWKNTKYLKCSYPMVADKLHK